MDRKAYKVTVLGDKGARKIWQDMLPVDAKSPHPLAPGVRTLIVEDRCIIFCDINMGSPHESHYQGTNAFVFVYDLSNIRSSFSEMMAYIKEVVEMSGKDRLMQIPHCVVLIKPDPAMSADRAELLNIPEPKHTWLTHITVGSKENVGHFVDTLLFILKTSDFSFPKWVPTQAYIDWTKEHCGVTGPTGSTNWTEENCGVIGLTGPTRQGEGDRVFEEYVASLGSRN